MCEVWLLCMSAITPSFTHSFTSRTYCTSIVYLLVAITYTHFKSVLCIFFGHCDARSTWPLKFVEEILCIAKCVLQHTATHCITLQHTATHCNTLQHTATHSRFVEEIPYFASCDMLHAYVWHDSFICVTCLIHMHNMPHSCVWHASFTSVTSLIHMCDMPHSYMWYASCICVTSLIHMCDMPHSFVWQAAFTSVTCLIHSCDKPPDAVRLGAEIGLAVMGRVAWEGCITCGGTHYHIHNRNVRGR